jgi:hypothetical protein
MIDPELNGISPNGNGSQELSLGGESSVTASAPRRFRFGLELTF